MFIKSEISVRLGEYWRITVEVVLPCDIPIHHAQLHCWELQPVSMGTRGVGVAIFWPLIEVQARTGSISDPGLRTSVYLTQQQ